MAEQLTPQQIAMLERDAVKQSAVTIKQVTNGYIVTGRTQYVMHDQIVAEKTDQAIAPDPWAASDRATGYMMYYNFTTSPKDEAVSSEPEGENVPSDESSDEDKTEGHMQAAPVDPVPDFLRRQMEGKPMNETEEAYEREVAAQRIAAREGHGGTYPLRS